MQTSLVLTVLSDDRPGLVKMISEVLKEYEGNWTESRMIHLAGKFAGLLKVTAPESKVDLLVAALTGMQDDGIEITVEVVADTSKNANGETLVLEVLGQDSPGIVNAITQELSSLQVNVEELISEQRSAPMSSETLFYAKIDMSLPEGLSARDVQKALEAMPDQLMVDIQFGD
ncbi:glycine cleavage system protein R [Leucothrix pacifica]|uniref:Glycine cleavage system transcriptional repressor n=1 Tax=Leucothrix pacifica TaxID=1247513 RepID=A0A317C1Y7_9GAMM|nr:ACT domain-containing protein [Leucothrix pacifica]PWQ92377.1 ACT domain protein [Leucothrix pacifica]